MSASANNSENSSTANRQRPLRDSRYHRPRRSISWVAIVIGIIMGVAGGLYWAWQVAPIEETDTAPWQLNAQNRADYVVAIMLAYSYDSDLNSAYLRLLELRPEGDPIEYVAEVACDLARSGYVDSASGERAIRSMMTFYQNQGRSGCADTLLPVVMGPTRTPIPIVGTPTLPQAPTKTNIPTLEPGVATSTPEIRVAPTVIPQGAFEIVRFERFCDANTPGLLIVQVQDSDGGPLPGQRVRVTWRDGRSDFLTGIKPGQTRDYADFVMDAGVGYTVDMPGLSDPSQVATSDTCFDPTGRETRSSYRAIFRPAF
jgi:hypothetical protein